MCIRDRSISYEVVDTSSNQGEQLPSVTRTIIELEGDPVLFNDFFKTDHFFFEKGNFRVNLDYTGEIVSMDQLLQEAKVSFHLANGEVFYKPVDVTFPLTEIGLDLDKDIASFHFLLRSDTFQQELYFDGSIEHFSEVLIGNTGKALKFDARVRSPKLEWKRFTELFAATGRHEVTYDNKLEAMKAAVNGILKTFDPHVDLQVDTFIFAEHLMIDDLSTSFYLKDTSTLVLDSTRLNFYDGNIALQAQFNLSEEKRTSFTTNIKTEAIDLTRLCLSMDYFDSGALKSVEKLLGLVSMDVDLAGVIAGDGLIPERTKGSVKFDLYDMVLKGLPPLDTIAAKFRMEKRLEEILFAPISNQIYINGEEITVPLMEVQSNAFHLFVEGVYSYRDQTNIWISFPLDNLRRPPDLSIIPEKSGYWVTGRKVYMEVQTDDVGANKFKFRLSKRKFYKQRNILKQYRKDKRRNRKARRAWKKARR